MVEIKIHQNRLSWVPLCKVSLKAEIQWNLEDLTLFK